jgi:EAL and modified HD-GYP domain-containing signal transduction protein
MLETRRATAPAPSNRVDHGMSETLLARQAIIDRRQRVVAYELLFRGPGGRPTDAAADRATSEVLLNAFSELSIDDVIGGRRAFVNFTAPLILSPPPFDPRRLVVEVLEDVTVDAHLVAALARLRRAGYTIALDDFVWSPAMEPLLDLAQIVKLDVLALSPAQLAEHVGRLQPRGLQLLAEKVETRAQFDACVEMGFQMFQGFFFARPEAVTGNRTPASEQAVLSLLAALHDPRADFPQLRRVIANDPVLSVKLLKLVNSAAVRRSERIDSLQAALALLGMARVRNWASLLALSRLAGQSPVLAATSLVRAQVCERIGALIPGADAASYFTVGLLSALDAIFGRPLAQVLGEIPVSDAVRDALLAQAGAAGLALRTSLCLERGDFAALPLAELAAHGIDTDEVSSAYRAALAWAEATESALT